MTRRRTRARDDEERHEPKVAPGGAGAARVDETPDGLDVTLRGLQKAIKKALELRAWGNEGAAGMLALR